TSGTLASAGMERSTALESEAREGTRSVARGIWRRALGLAVCAAAIAGCAPDDRGIREIRLYIDGHLANTCRPTQARPDVSQIFPQYARGRTRHGWTMLAGFDVPGPHTLIVQAVDSDGATRDIGVLNVTAIDK